MPKSTKPPRGRAGGKSRSLVATKPKSVALAVPQRLVLGDHDIHPEQILQIPERRPYGEGPWLDEPDRVAWRDAATGYSCLILRQRDGALAGFVGVGPSHPLWCFERDAIPPTLGISAHYGIDYAALCDPTRPSHLQICHVRHATGRQHQASMSNRPDLADGRSIDAWWFGFACNSVGDFLPLDPSHNNTSREDGPKTYRDIGYVASEVIELASKLRALEDQTPCAVGPGAYTGVPLALESKPQALLPRKGGRDV